MAERRTGAKRSVESENLDVTTPLHDSDESKTPGPTLDAFAQPAQAPTPARGAFSQLSQVYSRDHLPGPPRSVRLGSSPATADLRTSVPTGLQPANVGSTSEDILNLMRWGLFEPRNTDPHVLPADEDCTVLCKRWCNDAFDALNHTLTPTPVARSAAVNYPRSVTSVARDALTHTTSVAPYSAVVYPWAVTRSPTLPRSSPLPVRHAPIMPSDYCICSVETAVVLRQHFGVHEEQPIPIWTCMNHNPKEVYVMLEGHCDYRKDIPHVEAIPNVVGSTDVAWSKTPFARNGEELAKHYPNCTYSFLRHHAALRDYDVVVWLTDDR